MQKPERMSSTELLSVIWRSEGKAMAGYALLQLTKDELIDLAVETCDLLAARRGQRDVSIHTVLGKFERAMNEAAKVRKAA